MNQKKVYFLILVTIVALFVSGCERKVKNDNKNSSEPAPQSVVTEIAPPAVLPHPTSSPTTSAEITEIAPPAVTATGKTRTK